MLKEMRVCDVLGTSKNVKSYRVQVHVADTENGDPQGPPLLDLTADLSPRAVDRLTKWVSRGMRPTQRKATT